MSSALPLPVATLLRRSRNAKSPRDRHDAAYYAWEVAIRLAVAAQPPENASDLVRPTAGHWVGAMPASAAGALSDAAVRSLHGHLTHAGTGKRATPQSVRPAELLDALVAYRNKVIGHGAPTRPGEFYAEGAMLLADGLAAAWAAGVFLPSNAQLFHVESVEEDETRRRRARLLELRAGGPEILDAAGTPDVPDAVTRGRVVVRTSSGWTSLFPWVLYRPEGESTLFYNSCARQPEYLDFASGDVVRGAAVEELAPGARAALSERFRTAPKHAAPAPAPSASRIIDEDPRRFGDFELHGKLGEGGMGVVYLARQTSLDRVVALKMLPPGAAEDSVAAGRFRREMAALSRCDHPNVVKILASGDERGRLWYAMEYVEGADLAAVAGELRSSSGLDEAVSSASGKLREKQKETFAQLPAIPRAPAALSERRADKVRELAAAMRDAALGLEHLHAAGVVHRDVKPGNLMLTPERRVVVMDLGLAAMRNASRSLTRDKGSILGTLRYMPPEQLQRSLLDVDERSDVYALGATFYELLAGRALFEGEDEAALIRQVLYDEPPPAGRLNPALPGDLATIVGKCVAKDPRSRYRSAQLVADDVQAWLDGRPIAARPPTFGYYVALAVRRNRPLAAAVLAMVVVLVTALAVSLSALDRANDEREAKDKALWQATETAARERDTLRRARALGLTAASQVEVANQPMRGLLLARAAVRLDPSAPPASNALRDSVFRSHERAVLRGHDGEVMTAAFSPDGTRIITASEDQTARLWDASGTELAVLRGHRGAVKTATFSPDGSRIVTTSADKTARLWDTSGAELAVLRGHEGPVQTATFSPDGTKIVTASADKTGRLWNSAGKELAVLRGHESWVATACFSPDGARIVTGSWDTTARIWDLAGRELAVLRGQKDGVATAVCSPRSAMIATADYDTAHLWDMVGNELAVLTDDENSHASAAFQPECRTAAFSDDGTRVVTACRGEIVRLWDASGKALAVLRGHEGRVQNVGFSPDGSMIVAASADGTARLWDTAGTELVVLRGHAGMVRTAVFSPDGTRIVTASVDKTARLWDASGTELAVLRGHQGQCQSAEFSSDGAHIVTTSGGMTTRLWSTAGKQIADLDGHHQGRKLASDSAAFSLDGSRIVTTSADKTARLWDTSGAELAVLRGHEDTVQTAALSPEGTRIVTGSEDKTARLWDTGGKELAVLRGHDDTIWTVGFSPDGTSIVTGSRDKTARVWDADGRALAVLRGHEGEVSTAEFSPDGTRIVTTSSDQTARVWDTDGSELAVLHGQQSWVQTARFSPDSTKIATACDDNAARLWDATGREVAVLRGHENQIRTVRFSPDGTRIVTASWDKTARIWDLAGTELVVLRGHRGGVFSAAFSPDGTTIITASADGSARLWLVRTEDVLTLADTRITREFTDAERRTYADLLGDDGVAKPR